jgi:hypothetical protein
MDIAPRRVVHSFVDNIFRSRIYNRADTAAVAVFRMRQTGLIVVCMLWSGAAHHLNTGQLVWV